MSPWIPAPLCHLCLCKAHVFETWRAHYDAYVSATLMSPRHAGNNVTLMSLRRLFLQLCRPQRDNYVSGRLWLLDISDHHVAYVSNKYRVDRVALSLQRIYLQHVPGPSCRLCLLDISDQSFRVCLQDMPGSSFRFCLEDMPGPSCLLCLHDAIYLQ